MTGDDIVKIITDAAKQDFLNAVKQSVMNAMPDDKAEFSMSPDGESVIVTIIKPLFNDNGATP